MSSLRLKQYLLEIQRIHGVSEHEARSILKQTLDSKRREKLAEPDAPFHAQKSQRVKILENRTKTHPARLRFSGTARAQVHREPYDFKNRPLRQPVPGSIASVMIEAYLESGENFSQAFLLVRDIPRFHYLDDAKLRQRFRETLWRYGYRVRAVRP